jgi:hypothetical protein
MGLAVSASRGRSPDTSGGRYRDGDIRLETHRHVAESNGLSVLQHSFFYQLALNERSVTRTEILDPNHLAIERHFAMRSGYRRMRDDKII